MSIEFTCSCGRDVRVKDELAGKKIRCPGCGNPLKVPSAGDAAEATATAKSSKGAPKAEKGKEETRRRQKKSTRSVPEVKPATADEPELAPTKQREREGTRTRTKAKSSEAAPAVRTPATKTEGLLSPLADAGKTTGKKTFPCPGCGAALYVGDILCITCGMDLSTGQWILPEPQVSMKASMAKLVVGLIIGVGGIGGGAWYFMKNDPILTGNKPANAAAKGGETPAPDVADAPLRQDIEENLPGGLDSLAPLLAERKGDALPTLAELAQKTELSVAVRMKALKGIVLLARRGYVSPEGMAALDSGFNDADLVYRTTVLEGLHVYADPQAISALDGELAGPGGQIPAGASPGRNSAAPAIIQRATNDPADPLYLPAIRKLILCGQSDYAGVLITALGGEATAAAQAGELLRTMTARTFGKPEEWRAWWDQNSGKGVYQWLVDALLAADNTDRTGAHAQLQQLTGHGDISPAEGDAPEGWKACAEAWANWLSYHPR